METYENTLENTIITSEVCACFSKNFPRIILANDWSSGKNVLPGEMDMEKACYLLCVDDLLEEILAGGC